MSSESSNLRHLVTLARRRTIRLRLAAWIGWGLTAFLLATALVLLLGTGNLGWAFPLIVMAAALGILAWRKGRNLPDEYSAAQQLDRGLGLNDLLSSAWHAARTENHNSFAALLIEQAENASRSADAAQALPWRWPRAARWAGCASECCILSI